MFRFVDMYRPTSPPAGWQTMGILIHKATEGLHFQDPALHTRRSQFNPSGVWGFYHAFRGDVDARAQARYFVSYAKPAAGDILALDFEQFAGTWLGRSHSQLASMAAAFMDELHNLCHKNRIGLYCNKSDYDTIIKPYRISTYDFLWLAWYTSVTPDRSKYPWTFWQYAVINDVDWNQANFSDKAAAKAWSLGSTSASVTNGGGDMSMTTLKNGRVAVVTRGTDRHIYTMMLAADGQIIRDWVQLTTNPVASGVDVITREEDDLWIVALDEKDRSILMFTIPDAMKADATVQDLGGKGLGYAPGITESGANVLVTVAGLYPRSGSVYLKVWNGTTRSWTDWKHLGGVTG